MTNKEVYVKIFAETFATDLDSVGDLKYRESEQWDSIGHMSLISELEDAFDIEFEPDEIRALHSYEDGKTILASKGIVIE